MAESGGQLVGVVIPAAGSGTRMGGVKKTFLELRGEPVLLRAIHPFLARNDVRAVVVALAPEDAADPPMWLRGDPRVAVVPGGATRTDSVRAGLAALPPEVSVVLIHDGARPLVTPDVIDRCVRESRSGRGAVAGCPAVDTMKVVDERARVVKTPDRTTLWHAQTPQAFPRIAIEAAYASGRGGDGATDDASLAEAAGVGVVMVLSDPWNIKVTRKEDLEIADFVLRSRST